MGLDSQSRHVLEQDARLAPKQPSLLPADLRAQTRERSKRYGLAPEKVGRVEEYAIAGEGGDIAVRAYQPSETPPETGYPTLIYFHGGGFVVGDLDTHDGLCRFLCHHAEVQVIAVDYRLAPEAIFPAAHDDALAVFDAITMAPVDHQVDLSRLIVGGDSAGGNIAVTLAHRSIGRDDVMLAGQLLLYPWLKLSPAPDSPSKRHFGERNGLDLASLNQFALMYDPRLNWEHPKASPFFLNDLWGLPPSFVASIEHDPLCDEAEVFAMRLAQQGIGVTWRRYLGTIHSCAVMAGAIDQGRYMLEDAVQWLRGACH
ncbi:alpha/beta hydrolase [Larsenimonas salina]|uniref:alpha/beta hydrolase n=1 Tax=Larsenimonas salina TaxID=1295565 RepID=UPI0020735DD2|nr:alpha/beta hydrolase [Larsenimonas salina]MCM5704182.1 alpha/beta hydrolase [Larsenimonas salina]